jgi:hypothetical protein
MPCSIKANSLRYCVNAQIRRTNLPEHTVSFFYRQRRLNAASTFHIKMLAMNFFLQKILTKNYILLKLAAK